MNVQLVQILNEYQPSSNDLQAVAEVVRLPAAQVGGGDHDDLL